MGGGGIDNNSKPRQNVPHHTTAGKDLRWCGVGGFLCSYNKSNDVKGRYLRLDVYVVFEGVRCLGVN